MNPITPERPEFSEKPEDFQGEKGKIIERLSKQTDERLNRLSREEGVVVWREVLPRPGEDPWPIHWRLKSFLEGLEEEGMWEEGIIRWSVIPLLTKKERQE